MNITKRDIKFFLIGIVTILLVDTLWNWEERKQAFKDGWNAYGEDATPLDGNN